MVLWPVDADPFSQSQFRRHPIHHFSLLPATLGSLMCQLTGTCAGVWKAQRSDWSSVDHEEAIGATFIHATACTNGIRQKARSATQNL